MGKITLVLLLTKTNHHGGNESGTSLMRFWLSHHQFIYIIAYLESILKSFTGCTHPFLLLLLLFYLPPIKWLLLLMTVRNTRKRYMMKKKHKRHIQEVNLILSQFCTTTFSFCSVSLLLDSTFSQIFLQCTTMALLFSVLLSLCLLYLTNL